MPSSAKTSQVSRAPSVPAWTSAIVSLDTSKLSGTIDRTKTTGFGAMSAIDYIGAHNIGSYIAGAAIGNAYIADLHGDKIHANTLNANRIQANTITSRELSTGLLITDDAQIGNAVITNAKIRNAEITHLKLTNNALTTAASVSGSASGSGIDTDIYCRQGGMCVVIASYAGYTYSGTRSMNVSDITFTLYADGNAVSGSMVSNVFKSSLPPTSDSGETQFTVVQLPVTRQWRITNPNEGWRNFRIATNLIYSGVNVVLTVLEFAR